MPSSAPASDRIHRVLDRVDEAAEHCGAFSKPQLNQTGLVERRFWYTRWLQVVAERAQILFAREYFCARPSRLNRRDDPADELFDAALPIWRADSIGVEVSQDTIKPYA